ncbi:conserved hypothetical protein [Leishmania major strain Friedlin]|uniref:Uncharacterized protein n=1 Tax=Leishmania major TaxID=5664 RepID=O97008_LEIMA|nr:conserved hypothetical protein [Leishmania major strain Friedlin]CAC22635.1 conserved hypothetical protein [Leishmania major strain Friedlin]CAG9567795.1 hypothetical_protein_-_conserved [Leishmania major strain Friedlin]|eukprot:XP_888602.1 conserved hypothetical protein [Leishmania major strain Friedlin]
MANSRASTLAAAAAAASTAAVKPLSYVSLRSHDGKHVILPVAAAAGSRVLHGIFQGLYVMRLHQCNSPADQPPHAQHEQYPMVEEDAQQGELHIPRSGSSSSSGSDVANKAHGSAEVKVDDPIPIIEDEDDIEEDEARHQVNGAAYRSYAAVFPSNVACVPPPPSPLLSTSPPAAPSPCVPPLLEVPICSLEFSTLMRVAEFLVVKITLASHPHYLHEANVFGDLDRTSERDQLVAMQVLLGADFLNC